MSTRRPVRVVLSLASTLVLAALSTVGGGGCAVTTVDVDVYKGPLANHIEVQTQQAAGFAFASKPLLARLRFKLERDFIEQEKWKAKEHNKRVRKQIPRIEKANSKIADPTKKQKLPELMRELDDVPYWVARTTAYIRPGPTDEHNKVYQFESTLARAVNDLLSQFNTAAESERVNNASQADVLSIPPGQQRQDAWRAYEARLQSAQLSRPELLARGSSRPGLETLFELYAAEREQQREKPDAAYPYPHRHRLFEALLYFAQSMTVIANNEILLREKGDTGPLREFAGDFRFFFVGDRESDVPVRAYERLLQGIGNTIQIQINELRETQEHADDQRLAAAREAQGIRAALQRAPRDVLTDLQQDLAARLSDVARRKPMPSGEAPNLDNLQTEITRTQGIVDNATSALDAARQAAAPKRDEVQSAVNNAALLETAEELMTGKLLRPRDRATVLEAKDQVDGATLRTAVLGAIDNIPDDRADAARRAALKQVFNDNELVDASTKRAATSRAEAVKWLKGKIAAMRESAIAKVDALRKELRPLEAKVAEAEKALATAQSDASERKRQLQNMLAAQALGEVIPKTLSSTELSAAASPNATHDLLKRTIDDEISAEQKLDGGGNADRLKRLQAAKTYVNGWTPATPLNVRAQPGDKATDVLDTLIAALRHEHTQAIRRAGAESPEAKRFQEALENAYAQRAGMQYIRPSSAFLRTSFAATTLQRDARIGWQNTLAQHMGHQLPGADYAERRGSLRTILELDKQFWQNINTVRVAGGGDTNYVLVKDDIGNWYVKNYSTDPEDVINAAQSLALFGLGPGMGAPGLLAAATEQKLAAQVQTGKIDPEDAAKKAKEVQDATQPATDNAGAGTGSSSGTSSSSSAPLNVAAKGPIIQRQLSAARTTYDDDSARHLTQVQTDAAALKGVVASGWSSEPAIKTYKSEGEAELVALLDASAGQYLDRAKDVKPPDGRDADAILDALRLMKQFHGDLAGRIATYAAGVQSDPALTEAIEKGKSTKDQLDAAKERQQAIEDIKTVDAKIAEIDEKLVKTPPPDEKKALDDQRTKFVTEKASLEKKRGEADEKAGGKSVEDAQAAYDAAKKPAEDAQAKRKNAPAATEAARARMTKLVREAIEKTLADRDQSIGRYETELDLLARTAGQ